MVEIRQSSLSMKCLATVKSPPKGYTCFPMSSFDDNDAIYYFATCSVLIVQVVVQMIRLITLSLSGSAYLNFMGNEFGHPKVC
jgi:hypothetical protein